MLSHRIPQLIQRASGLAVSLDDVRPVVRQRMRLHAISDMEAYAATLINSEQELSELIELVVVPETWLFRDPAAFAAATSCIQAMLHEQRRPVRALCVPCATGEEPYSLAMSVLDAGIAPDHVSIEGVDISRNAIERARRAIYGKYAFRARDLGFRERHFQRTDDGYALNGAVRDMVTFRHGNLLVEDNFSDTASYDLIFCRNLLIYFDAPTQQAAVRRLYSLLADGGMLFSGYAEAPLFSQRGFQLAPYAKAFAVKKIEAEVAKLPAVSRPPLRPVQRPVWQAVPPPVVSDAAPAPTPIPAAGSASPAVSDRTILLTRSRSLADAGEYELASHGLREYLQDFPESDEAHLVLGIIHERMGDTKAAEECLRRVVYLNPDHYEALCHLSLLAEQRGNRIAANAIRERAARVFRRAGRVQHGR